MIKLISGDTLTALPNPLQADTQTEPHALLIHRSMNGTRYVYPQTAQTQVLNYDFRLSKMKSLELRRFLLKYYDSEIKLENHKDETWLVRLTNQPFTFNALQAALNLEGGERVSITLQFEGTLQ